MPMTPEQGQKLRSFLDPRGIPAACPNCQHPITEPGEIVIMSIYSGARPPSQVVPVAQLICQNCQNVRLFLATAIGLV